MATVAAIVGAKLPDTAAEDSYSLLPIWRGEKALRPATVHHSGSGKFAIRQGDWVLIDAASGDDNREPDWFREQRGVAPSNQPGQLYNLKLDLAQRFNRYPEQPEVVARLRALLEGYKKNGRSTPGAAQANDVAIGSGVPAKKRKR